MKKLLLLFSCFTVISLSSCEELQDIIPEEGLTNDEVIKGLKEALAVSTDTSVSILNAMDGYYGDQAVKILLPPEASVIFDNISKIPGGSQLVEQTILAVNRAAEDAAIEAKPIFVDAITGMSFQDAFGILNGHDSSATQYLHANTYEDLKAAFSPKISNSLNKPLVAGTSAESLYSDLVSKYNVIANASFGLLKPITQNTLGEYTTTKALDGLFKKVTVEEGKIRNNITHQVSDLLKRVFGG
ncbi:MAG: DUF4197 domain-containing protein [Bacteroidota bacterium]|nr:DUF4197 domain-containing protein [Bacteroidota bacterium]MDX5431831.1 DUF4197 domain-containing protein [Bacteroidota bacterium]MDX5470544.1 DUF4197 domain-containing protein [Bacteroidota bacterium]